MDAESAKQELLSQTSKIQWRELQRFFASGKVIYVSTQLDLITVATALIQDKTEHFTQWTNDNHVHAVNDDQALQWYEQDITLWAAVVSPWVLVQEINQSSCSFDLN